MLRTVRPPVLLVGVLSLIAALAVPLSLAAAADEPAIDVEVLEAVGDTSALMHVADGMSLDAGIATAREAGLRTGTTYPRIDVFVAYGTSDAFRSAADTGRFSYLEYNRPIELFTDTSHEATRGQEVLDGTVTLDDGTRIDGDGVGVAVVDSGVDGTHPDLADRMGGNVRIYCTAPGGVLAIGVEGGGFSECRGPKTAVELDDTDTPGAGGHGTHVAGIAAGDGTASEGDLHGAAPGATWYGVGVGTALVVENALDGLAWVLENHDQVEPGIRVVNNSWGSGHEEYDPDSGFYSATHKLIEELVAEGVVVVFAAGNSGGDGSSATTSAQCVNPTPGVICVADYDDGDTGTREGELSSTSSRGEDGAPGTYPDLSAPGTTITSTCRITLPVCSANGSPAFDNAYSELSGTSMAAPHVAGIATQLLQADPTLTPAQVEDVLEDTAYPFTFGGDYETDPFNPDSETSFDKGHGLVDVLAALEAVLAGGGDPDDSGGNGNNGNNGNGEGNGKGKGKGNGKGHGKGGNPDKGKPDDPGQGRGQDRDGGGTSGDGPTDYIALGDTLSRPDFPETVRDPHMVDMPDGEQLYVEIVRPDPQLYGDGPWPVIMEASPYHGTIATRIGDRIFPDPVDADGEPVGLTGYFAPRGYAVAIVDLRGTGRSTGCLDHLGPNDASDLKTVVEWAADQTWSNGKVGMTGHSYVGSTPSVAAAQDPEGLATIVPSAGLASMYDHQFNKGVPWLLQWVGPQVAYPSLATERDLPSQAPGIPVIGGGNTGDNFDENGPNPQTGCGWQNSALLAGSGQATGQYEGWHAERDWGEAAAAADIPIFMIHGVNDNAARIPAAEWFFDGRFDRTEDKVWIGQWDHGSTNGRCGDEDGSRTLHPTCRFDQFQYALHAWFDEHLKGMDVDTGPAVEAFLNGTAPVDITRVVDPETIDSTVYVADAWRQAEAQVGLYPDATDGTLRFSPPENDGSDSFSTDANAVAAYAGSGAVTFTSAPVDRDTVLLGKPDLRLHASITNEITHLVTTLYREDENDRREPINFCAIQPQLREGIDTITPVVPGEEMSLDLQCFTMAHHVHAGDRLVLEVATRSPHHATFGSDPEITVYTGPDRTAYALPEVVDATLHDDVPLREDGGDDTEPEPTPDGPAQPPIEGSVTVPASAVDLRVDGVTTGSFEFDAEEGFDNAEFEAHGVTQNPADIDLYLQRQQEDGSWSADLSAGASFDFAEETLTYGRLDPGRYRIVVHNWAGPPTTVDLTLTYFDSEGAPGGG